MIATIVKEPFITWIKNVVEERNKKVSKKKGDMITMDPAIAAAFYASSKVSRKYIFLFVHPNIIFFFSPAWCRSKSHEGRE